jgi:hypothetical protein
MRIGYIRADNRMGEAPQREVLEAAGISPNDIRVEGKGSAQPVLTWIIERKIRKSESDTVEVSDLHRLCSNSECMAEMVSRIAERNAVVVEARTGARSDRVGPFSVALAQSIAFLSGRLTRADRSRIGKLGAEASPVTKPKGGHMPLAQIQTMINDHAKYPTLMDAIEAINRDRRYRRKVNASLIYRWARDKKIDMIRRIPGPKT